MQSLDFENFTREEVVKALHSSVRKISFRFELLDKNRIKKKDLTNIKGGSVDQNSSQTLKRTAKFTLVEDPQINYLSDWIKPYIRIYINQKRIINRLYSFVSQFQLVEMGEETSGKNGWIEFSLGEFLLTSPTRKEENGVIIREIAAYDGLLILSEDKFEERHFIPSGTPYHEAVVEIIESAGITRHSIEPSTKLLEDDIEFEPGKSKLEAINELLRSGIYEELHVNADGIFVSKVYRNPSIVPYDYSYATDRKSVVFGGYEEQLDYFGVANKFVVVRSLPDRPPLKSTYINNNPDSPTSTVNRGRTIPFHLEIDNIADQASLDEYVERLAFEQSQVYGIVKFESAIMPFHDYMDILDIQFDDLIGNGKYVETAWSIPFEVGGKMTHEVRRVAPI